MSTRFEDLGLSKELLRAVEDMGFEEPSPIQVLAIPHILEGRDIVGQAQTGTGKTAAFGLPLLEKLDPRAKLTQALILCPTRELAIQVAEEVGKLAQRRKISVLPIYGGQPIERQFRALEKGAQVIVGTPGRVMDHMERGTLSLNAVSIAVLDEADEMLDMGFRDDIEHILEHTPENSQRIFFSATMPAAIMEMAKRFLNEPEIVKITRKQLTVPSVEQTYYEVRPHQKMEALCRVIDSSGFRKALVFCSTKRSVDELTSHLMTRGYLADGLHGNLAQPQRDRVMGRFRTGGIEILVATDVAARGIDVDDVDAVINYDIPHDVENYVHRIGRTGRAGRAGKAFTFVTAREHYRLRDIIRFTKARIVQSQLPTLNDVVNIKTGRLLNEVRATIESGSLERHTSLVESFLDDDDSTSMDMAAALLKILMQRDFGIAETDANAHDVLQESGRDRNRDRERRFPERTKTPGGKERFVKPLRTSHSVARLFFNVGSKMNVAPRDLVGAIAGETGIPGRSIGAIEIHERFSFVEVPSKVATEVMSVMNGSQIRGFRVAVEIATPKS
jgi:Superfamily II DNA and RNA helicases